MGIDPLRRSRALLLDRDGVINRSLIRNGIPHPPVSVEELEILPGVADALRCSRSLGFLNLVISNQPDVARGTQSRARVEEINAEIGQRLCIDDMFLCYHDDDDGCNCRKPLPGLIIKAAVKYRLDLSASFVIGDRWRDIDAGHAAGCRTILVDYGYQERQCSRPPAARVASLAEAITLIGRIEHEPALENHL